MASSVSIMRTTAGVLLVWGLSIAQPAPAPGSSAPVIDRDRLSLVLTEGAYAIADAHAQGAGRVEVPRAWLVPPEEERASAEDYLSAFDYSPRTNAFEIGDGRLGIHCSSYAIMKEGSAGYAAGRDKFLVYDPRRRTVREGGLVAGVTRSRIRLGDCLWQAEHTRLFVGDVDGDGLADIALQEEGLPCPSRGDGAERTAEFDGLSRYRHGPLQWYVLRGDRWQRAAARDATRAPAMTELPMIDQVMTPVTFALTMLLRLPTQGPAASPELKPYPGAKAFCTQHVSGARGPDGPGPHIIWTGYASPDPPATVVAYYQRELGREQHRREGKKDIWRVPQERPERVLTVSAAAEGAPPSPCQPPPASAATVIVISTMVRPR